MVMSSWRKCSLLCIRPCSLTAGDIPPRCIPNPICSEICKVSSADTNVLANKLLSNHKEVQ